MSQRKQGDGSLASLVVSSRPTERSHFVILSASEESGVRSFAAAQDDNNFMATSQERLGIGAASAAHGRLKPILQRSAEQGFIIFEDIAVFS
jgi:hypothetical protein